MANTIADLNSKLFRLKVKQHAAVLEFTDSLEERMAERNVSQQQLATILGKTRSWISKVFRRKPNLTFFTAVELADAVGLDLHIEVVERQTLLPAAAISRVHILRSCGVFPAANDSASPVTGISDMAA